MCFFPLEVTLVDVRDKMSSVPFFSAIFQQMVVVLVVLIECYNWRKKKQSFFPPSLQLIPDYLWI